MIGTDASTRFFAAAVLVGGLLRAASLPLPGTGDVGVYKVWTYSGAANPPTELYGVGGSPTDWRILDFHGVTGQVVYPPLALYALAAVGRVYQRVSGPDFVDSVGLTIAVKTPIVLAEAGLILLLHRYIRRTLGTARARWTTLAYWLNPGTILTGSMLGYLDPLFTLPAIASLIAVCSGWMFASGALMAAAALIKPQAVVLGPALCVAAWNAAPDGIARRFALVAAGGAAVTAIVVGPIIAAGAFPNLMLAMSRLVHHDMISGNACNLWWVVDYVLRVAYSVHDLGWWNAITMRVRILAITRVIELGYPNPRIVGTILASLAILWGTWTARRARDWFLICAAGAFLMHAYATLAAQVHENHLFAAIPLLAIAAAARARYRPLFWVLSALYALNLNLFYGISEYRVGYALPRSMTVVDFTVLVALANCGAFVWHAALLRSECASPSALPSAAV